MNATISFIIPAYNEENNIRATIESIQSENLGYDYEIIVIDHNSTDKTNFIAKQLSTTVIEKQGGTISSVRNYGVKISKGDILVFLDADVTLTKQWFASIGGVVLQIQHDSYIIAGSHCAAPENGNWIERNWFNNYVHEKNTTNLGAGHMIISRQFFSRIGGFDEGLITGEDYAFCMAGLKAGGRIINNSGLRVIHNGYPATLVGFIKREAWHGKGDATSVSATLESKVAIASLLFVGLHVAIVILLFSTEFRRVLWTIPIAGIIALVVFSSWRKFGHCNLLIILINSVIFYFYFLGRSLSFARARSRYKQQG